MREFMAIAKALADENRVRILMFLREGESCVCEIMGVLNLAPSTVSKHLALLRQAGLIESRKDGRWVYCALPRGDSPSPVTSALDWMQRCLENDPAILTDLRRLREVRGMARSELCLRYRPQRPAAASAAEARGERRGVVAQPTRASPRSQELL